jgi:hypothetical protein
MAFFPHLAAVIYQETLGCSGTRISQTYITDVGGGWQRADIPMQFSKPNRMTVFAFFVRDQKAIDPILCQLIDQYVAGGMGSILWHQGLLKCTMSEHMLQKSCIQYTAHNRFVDAD